MPEPVSGQSLRLRTPAADWRWARTRIEPPVQLPDICRNDNHEPVSIAVPKTGISDTPAENEETAELVSIALFSCTGLLISLVVVALRMYGFV